MSIVNKLVYLKNRWFLGKWDTLAEALDYSRKGLWKARKDNPEKVLQLAERCLMDRYGVDFKTIYDDYKEAICTNQK